MIAKDIINDIVRPLLPTDTSHHALTLMQEWQCNHLPVIEQSMLQGFLSEEVLKATTTDDLVSTLSVQHSNCYVNNNDDFFHLIKIAAEHDMPMIAVVNDDDTYQGVVVIQDAIAYFAQNMSIETPGIMLTLSIHTRDYSLATIGRIIEENNVKILASMVTEDFVDDSKIRLHLKVNTTDSNRVMGTLERFGYAIVGCCQKTPNTVASHERIDMLMRYLNT